MNGDQTQLFKMDHVLLCETFGCGEIGSYMVGRPDGPLNTCHVLCDECSKTLAQSVKELFDMHEKSVHTNKIGDAIQFEEPFTDALLDDITTHARLDDFIEQRNITGIPSRDEEGGKLHERKEAIKKKLSE